MCSQGQPAGRTRCALSGQEQRKLRVIYESCARDLARIAAALLRSVGADEGDDAVQEAFMAFACRAVQGELRCLDNRRVAEIPDAEMAGYALGCRAYLKRVVVHKCWEFCRRARQRPKPGSPWLATAVVVCDPAERLRADELAARLEEAVDGLSPKLRVTVVLRHFGCCSQEEIAAVLDIPVGTVKSRLHYAYRRLKAALARQQEETIPGGRVRQPAEPHVMLNTPLRTSAGKRPQGNPAAGIVSLQ